MLDLQALKATAPYQIKMEDGTVLNIKLPSQQLLEKMVALEDYIGKTADAIEAIYDIVVQIFNNNTNGLCFTIGSIKENYDFIICSYIIQDYLQEVTKQLGE